MISKKMTEELNKQMNYEIYSAYEYLSLSAFCSKEGLDGFANWFMMQYKEEMMHAMKFYDYILDQGEQVVLDQVPQPQVEHGKPLEMFEFTLEHEKGVTKRIYNLVDLALDERDHGTNAFLQWFVNEQVEEESTVNGILDQLKLVEGNGNGVFMLDRELGQRTFDPNAAQ